MTGNDHVLRYRSRELATASWNELDFALCATFYSDLRPHVLEMLPKDGPHAFTELRSKWLASASRKALDVLLVVAPPHSLRPRHLRLRRRFQGPCGMPEVAEVPPRGKTTPIMWGEFKVRVHEIN